MDRVDLGRRRQGQGGAIITVLHTFWKGYRLPLSAAPYATISGRRKLGCFCCLVHRSISNSAGCT